MSQVPRLMPVEGWLEQIDRRKRGVMEEIRFEPDCNTSIPHFHSEMEILYVLSGRIAIIGSGYNYVLEPEDFIVLNPYEHHELYAEAGCHTISGYVSPDLFQQSRLGRVVCCSRDVSGQSEYAALIRVRLAMLFKYHLGEPSPSRKLYVLSQLFGLLAILKAQFEVSGDHFQASGRDADRMQEVLTYLSMHFHENITMQEVADRVYISKSHLSREFQKHMGISFSDYLRRLRLNRVAYLLSHSEKTITEIALDCGFSNINTMIINFHEEYGETPGVYHKRHYRKSAGAFDVPRPDNRQEEHPADIISCMNLLKHAAAEEVMRPLDKKQQENVSVQVSLREDGGKLCLRHNDTISIGWANSLMSKSIHTVLQRAVREIGFRYIRFHGILDDVMDLYHEREDGRPWLSFTYMDIALDEIVDLGLKPFFEFSYMPRRLAEHTNNIFGASCIALPGTPEALEKWGFLVETVMNHLLERYGYEEVRQWRFAPINALYISYGVFTADKYLAYYEKTYRGIRGCLPEASIYGFGLDTGFIVLDGPVLFEHLLDHCRRHDCLPDAFTFQCFGCDYSKVPRSRTEDSISSEADRMTGEPAAVSADPDILKHEIAGCREIMQRQGLLKCPIHVCEWNSTIWQNDLGNDTCFKAAFIMKNILENCEDVTGISYTHLTDLSDRRVINSSLYHGGYGLLTYNGIPKAGYFAYQLLTMLQKEMGIVSARGEGYLVTRSEDYKRIQIVLYHYCHYDSTNHIDRMLSVEEQHSVDRYYGFEQKGAKSFRFTLTDLPEGAYMKRTFTINREHGSSYDVWMHLGAPEFRGRQQTDCLNNISSFQIHYEPLRITDSGEWIFSAVLDEHEVRLILIDRK